MKVSIARDGAELGDFPRQELERLARTGRLRPTDLYWREGMESWLKLEDLLGSDTWKSRPIAPPPPRFAPVRNSETVAAVAPVMKTEPLIPGPPLSGRFYLIAAVCVLLAALIAGGIYFIKARNTAGAATALFARNSTPAAIENSDPKAIQDKAVADLRQIVSRLPTKPAPPLYAFYYDISVNMKKSLSVRTPWTAILHGGENVVDPATEQTTMHTDFALTLDYRDNEWIFRRYDASESDMVKSVTTEIKEDEDTVAPPIIIAMMGIKIVPKEDDGTT
ncbi:MAG: DUF4339 domain-containing protein, partial [Verrucomicrobiota bacterium]|nr:DUF4339 domain-containing protein [Verrucomicrobiota bacterium]